MAKQTSFADKMGKAGVDNTKHCPVCDQSISTIKLVSAETSPKGAFRFRQKFVGICKCNEDEVTS